MSHRQLSAHAATPTADQTIAAHAIGLEPGQDAPAEWVHLLPGGTFRGRDGRGPYHVDAQAVIDATRAHHGSADIPIDYDHQILRARENGRPAIAAGWIKELEARNGEVWGRVEWTAAASAHIQAREYRYLSPVFRHQPDGTVRQIAAAALINIPNLDLVALAGQDFGERPMDEYQTLLEALGLKPDATAEQVAAHTASLTVAATTQGEIAQVLGLKPDAAPGDIKAAVEKLATAAHGATQAAPPAKPDPAEYVPMAAFQELQGQVAAMQASAAETAAHGAVEEATKAGKLSPALRDWGLEYATKDLPGFQAWAEKAPALAAHGAQPGGAARQATGAAGLDADELAVCSQLGIDPETYKKTRDAEKETA
ncbi:phage protease [Roseospirillum parvum]|uniref:Mu-like prophage I protein n=1 Tax=Roseospirillum parvum TaxID=83401 RepID=A0A1G8GBN3_9PROT|nr:phage protease [Roseospirillum parvum]SDH91787.1 Mu-like prophage I protein [Roseospirillum parvum]